MVAMKRAIVILTVLAFCLVSAGAAIAADKVSLNLGHTGSTSHHYHTASEKFVQLVKERTNGEVEINIFPASQLGSIADMTESVLLGTQDIVLTAGPILGNMIPEFQALYMPYIFRDYDHIARFEKSEAATILGDKLRDNGGVMLGWWENGFRVLTNSKKPIVKPEDMAGMKIRVGKAQIAVDTFKVLKVNPTPIAISELYTALQLGTVDGQENPTGRILSAKYYEVQKYLSISHHQHAFETLVMNRDKFDSLSAENQKILLETAAEVALSDRQAVADEEESQIEALREKGMSVNEVDMAAFQEAMSSLYDKYNAERGEEWKKLVELIQSL